MLAFTPFISGVLISIMSLSIGNLSSSTCTSIFCCNSVSVSLNLIYFSISWLTITSASSVQINLVLICPLISFWSPLPSLYIPVKLTLVSLSNSSASITLFSGNFIGTCISILLPYVIVFK